LKQLALAFNDPEHLQQLYDYCKADVEPIRAAVGVLVAAWPARLARQVHDVIIGLLPPKLGKLAEVLGLTHRCSMAMASALALRQRSNGGHSGQPYRGVKTCRQIPISKGALCAPKSVLGSARASTTGIGGGSPRTQSPTLGSSPRTPAAQITSVAGCAA
jgi:hypothetical protein